MACYYPLSRGPLTKPESFSIQLTKLPVTPQLACTGGVDGESARVVLSTYGCY